MAYLFTGAQYIFYGERKRVDRGQIGENGSRDLFRPEEGVPHRAMEQQSGTLIHPGTGAGLCVCPVGLLPLPIQRLFWDCIFSRY